MRNFLLTSAAFVLCAGGAIAAPAPVSGSVGVNVGADFTNFDINSPTYGTSGTAFEFGGAAHINAWLDNSTSVQLDVQADATTSIKFRNTCSNCSSDGRTGGLFGVHVSDRSSPNFLWGAFAGLSGQSNLDYDGTMTHVVLGVEGQYYDGPFTLYGQVGYAPLMSDSNENEPSGLKFLRGVGRYFLTDNDRVQLDVSYAASDVDGFDGAEYHFWNGGLSWQHRYPNSPFSSTIAYSGMWADSDLVSAPGNSAQENIVSVGFAIHFGDASLKEADRQGATLDMPNFGTAEAWSWWLQD